MDFKQIEAFVNVVRYKSFSKAADATFFTQPTISTHIRNLEKELGVKLLDRKSRVVEMTPQGSKFYKYAVEMINARAQAFDALMTTAKTLEEYLRYRPLPFLLSPSCLTFSLDSALRTLAFSIMYPYPILRQSSTTLWSAEVKSVLSGRR